MTIIFIENELGSGQIVTVAETFKTLTVERNLRPGESGRFLMSPLKSIVVNECMVAANACDDMQRDACRVNDTPYVPIKLTMCGNDD